MLERLIFFKLKNNIFTKYIIVGSINTFFGYFIGIFFFYIFYKSYGIIFVSLISSVFAISFSFFTYKMFVFRTVYKNWISEYLKSYIVYIIGILLSTIILWICIEILTISIFISQGLSVTLVALVSFIGHKNFTFK